MYRHRAAQLPRLSDCACPEREDQQKSCTGRSYVRGGPVREGSLLFSDEWVASRPAPLSSHRSLQRRRVIRRVIVETSTNWAWLAPCSIGPPEGWIFSAVDGRAFEVYTSPELIPFGISSKHRTFEVIQYERQKWCDQANHRSATEWQNFKPSLRQFLIDNIAVAPTSKDPGLHTSHGVPHTSSCSMNNLAKARKSSANAQQGVLYAHNHP